jgi:predicted extracellular nuclease
VRRSPMRLLAAATVLVVLLCGPLPAGTAVSSSIVVSQVYGGGGNSGATLTNDFVELFNPTASAVSVGGWSVQYASSAGTTWQVTALGGSIPPGGYYLVQEAAGAGGTTALPTPDATGSIAMSATSGKVALVSSTTALSGSCPTVLDFVGYGTATCFEGAAAAPGLTNTTADLRAAGGCTDTDSNSADFAAGAPNPRNSASPLHSCSGPTPPTGSGSASPASLPAGGSTLLTVAVTPGANPASTGITVTCDLTAIGGSAAQTLFDDGTNGDVTAGDDTFSFTATIAAGTTAGSKSLGCTVADAEARSGAAAIALAVEGPPTPIHDIQGAGHVSPLATQIVSTNGIVTAKSTNGFWMQDPTPDADPATSEGIFVFTSSAPAVAAGDAVHVNGRVQEFRPGGGASGNLSTTELSGSPSVTVVSSGNPLPPPTVVGTGGRVPPSTVIEDDATGNVETSGVFDPASDGLDFWESLEGMRVQLNDPVAVGPTNAFGETQVVGDDGANASVRTARGGLLLRPTDANPERVVVDDLLMPGLPTMNVGDHYLGSIVGVLDYNFGNFFVEATQAPPVAHDGVTPETTAAQGTDQVAVATFNVENLAPSDPQSKFDRLAGLIVHNLRAPDVISVEEVQDNSGATDNGVVAADQTLAKLVAAVAAAGGPAYDWRGIDPVDDQDGGQPGGNIRQVFLFRTDRGLSFVDRPGGGSTTATAVTGSGASTQLTFSPGRVDPANAAWSSSRKPLAGEFLFHGHHLFVIANHFNSKGGDDPLEGRFQPPTRSSEVQRHQQAQIVHDFVAQILAADPSANVVVDGDLNDFEFSDTVSILKSGVLEDLIDTLPQNERYSYVFEGNSQTLDHILVSGGLFARPFAYDVVHVNSEFADQASDHDPSVVRLTLDDPPTVSAGGPYTVEEGASVGVCAVGSDPEGDSLTFAWDLDDNGTFETPGQCATFDAPAGSAPSQPMIAVRATDPGGLSATASTAVQVTWRFTGFLSPLLNPPAVNQVKAGHKVKVRFSLGGDQGTAIFADGYPASAGHACGSAGPADAGEATTSPGKKGIHYDRKKDVYTYEWRTTKAWKHTCRTLVVKLADGTYHYAELVFE